MLVDAAWYWGPIWENRAVTFFCDNAADVLACQRGNASDPELVNLLNLFITAQMKFNFIARVKWIPTDRNVVADALSRVPDVQAHARQFGLRSKPCKAPKITPILSWQNLFLQSNTFLRKTLAVNMVQSKGELGLNSGVNGG